MSKLYFHGGRKEEKKKESAVLEHKYKFGLKVT